MTRLPRVGDAGDPVSQIAVIDQAADGPAGTRLIGLESRVAVAEKSTRALLVEVVRLQSALRRAMDSVNEERAVRRDAESRMRAATDALTRLEREKQRRQTDDDTAKSLLATAQDAQAAALAARQEAATRSEEQANRYQYYCSLNNMTSTSLPLQSGPQPFTPDFKPIRPTNPFLHSLSGSICTVFTDF